MNDKLRVIIIIRQQEEFWRAGLEAADNDALWWRHLIIFLGGNEDDLLLAFNGRCDLWIRKTVFILLLWWICCAFAFQCGQRLVWLLVFRIKWLARHRIHLLPSFVGSWVTLLWLATRVCWLFFQQKCKKVQCAIVLMWHKKGDCFKHNKIQIAEACVLLLLGKLLLIMPAYWGCYRPLEPH